MDKDLKEFFREVAAEEQCDDSSPLMAIGHEDLSRIASRSGLSIRETEIRALDLGYVPRRYMRNFREITPREQSTLLRSSIAIAGLGGLGGYILEITSRMGVGEIKGADGDSFDECNFNRQLLCTTETQHAAKASAAAVRARSINPSVDFTSIPLMLDRSGFLELLSGVDLVFDGLGGIEVKRVLLSCARERNIPLITGSVAGWTAFVTVVLPGGEGPELLWQGGAGAEVQLGCLGPAIGLAASVQCAEGVRLLCSGESPLAGRILAVDLKAGSYEILSL